MPTLSRSLVAPVLALPLLVGAAVVASVAPAAARSDRTLTARHANLTAPTDAVTRTLAPDQGCQVLLDSGDGDCAVVETAHGQLVFTVEAGEPVQEGLVSKPWTVRVYKPSATVPNGWEVALSTSPQGSDPGPLYANVTAKVADVTGDGADDLVLGYRNEGTGEILDMDIVGTSDDGTPAVLGHDEIYKGTVEVGGGHLVTHEPVYKTTDANCCPTWIERSTIRFRNGAFEVHVGRKVPTKRADVPPGDLG